MIDEAAPASKPSDVPSRGWKEVGKATWKEAGKDNVDIVAAGVAFYVFTALVPLLTAFVLTYGLVADPATVVSHVQSLSTVMPESATSLIGDQLKNLTEGEGSARGFALLIALAIAIYSASKGASSLMTAMNIIWDVEESRGFVKRTLMGIGMTVGAVLVMVLAIFSMTALGLVEQLLPALGGAMHFLIQLLSFALAAAAIMLLLAVIYRYAPNRPDAKWRWVTPGSMLATVVWVIATVGFAFYVANFGSYNATYGSLGAVIVFLTWLYLTAYIILLGGELNAVLEQEVADDPAKEGASQPDGQAAKSRSEAGGQRQEKRDERPSDPLAYPAQPKPKEPAPPSAAGLALRYGLAALVTSVLGSKTKKREGQAS